MGVRSNEISSMGEDIKQKEKRLHLRQYTREMENIPSLIIESLYRKDTTFSRRRPRKKHKPREEVASSKSIANFLPNSLINQLESRISNISTSEKKEVRCHLQELLKQTPSSPRPIISSPAAKSATAKFTHKLEHVTTPVRHEMYSAVKQSVRKK